MKPKRSRAQTSRRATAQSRLGSRRLGADKTSESIHPQKRRNRDERLHSGSRSTSQSRDDARYVLLWKPYGVLSQFSSPSESSAPTLKSLVTIPDVYPAGRLDRDSEGLLLLTNDGLFQHKLCDPKYAHWRTYWVQVERTPTREALDRLRHGVEVRGKITRPARVELLVTPPSLPPRDPPIRTRKSIETAWLQISLTEGMNRQVRRMTAAVGFPTLRLVRAEIELSSDISLTLRGLEPGRYRVLTQEELNGVTAIRTRQPQSSS